ncbi:MAG: hypothetical protein AAF799_28475 [Myxococcota bacterium]
MTEHDRDAIDASLRRQFEVPNLDALHERIEAAAAARPTDATEDVETEDVDDVIRLPPTTDPSAEPRSGALGSLVWVGVVAAAAALVLLWARPDGVDPGTASPTPDSGAEVIARAPDPPPTSHQVAGAQLTRFLSTAHYPGPDYDLGDCQSVVPPPPNCSTHEGAPVWSPQPEAQVVWECGGSTSLNCSDHDLPAQRLMVVRLAPSGPDVIVCIEPPWADPKPELPLDSGYQIFRRTLGEYVLYEVTPLSEPRAFDSLSI